MEELALTLPVLHGKRSLLEGLLEVLGSTKKREFGDSKKRLGVEKESWFLESSIRGDSLIMHWEGSAPQDSFNRWMSSSDSFDVWLKSQLLEVTGVDLNTPVPGGPSRRLMKYP